MSYGFAFAINYSNFSRQYWTKFLRKTDPFFYSTHHTVSKEQLSYLLRDAVLGAAGCKSCLN